MREGGEGVSRGDEGGLKIGEFKVIYFCTCVCGCGSVLVAVRVFVRAYVCLWPVFVRACVCLWPVFVLVSSSDCIFA